MSSLPTTIREQLNATITKQVPVDFAHRVRIKVSNDMFYDVMSRKIRQWCSKHIVFGSWIQEYITDGRHLTFWFKEESDAVFFRLIWS